MSTLDRYIIRSFLLNFTLLLAVLLGLFVVVDFIADIDEFLNAGPARARALRVAAVADQYGLDEKRLANYAERGVGERLLIEDFGIPPSEAAQVEQQLEVSTIDKLLWTAYVIVDYYAPTMLVIYVFFSGLVITGAMGFTLAAMARNRELTAIAAGGVSLYRVAAPILITGALLAATTLPLQEIVIPELGPKLLRGKSEIKYGEIKTEAVYFVPDGRGNLLTAGSFTPQTEDKAARIDNIRVLQRDASGQALLRRISGETALWDESRQAWRFIPEAWAATPERVVQEDRPQMPEAVAFFPTSLTPDVLLARQASQYLRLLSVQKLRTLAASEAVDARQRGRITRTIQSRFSLLVVSVLVLVVGLPYFLRVGRPNLMQQSIFASVACLGGWGGGVVMLQAGTGSLPAVFSAWLPVVVLLPLSAIGLTRIRT